ncbi:acyltransferase [Maribacter sp. HTCC2170]|uniref:acyltransferase n=1 Tax=Maribacter sp. (strain HTCC2170 / KCCM 42371) TaxID=313603 RepID=UPI00006B4903|nr:acyltransferase [Maribacter sp. HTCC2170]EAR01092.1 Acetyltransferase (isoleucine patch superfamily) protein [Maribacter sp. HTCC2170]
MKITPKKLFYFLKSKLLHYHLKSANIKLRGKVVFEKKPLLDIHENATLIIGDNVLINSQNKGYHVNMFNPCKLIADRPNAIIEIGDNTRFHGSCIHAYKKISIGKNCLIAANCQIIDGNGHDISFPNTSNRINTRGSSKEVIIEDNVWLATGVIVLPGVTIGKGSIITANSVVHKNIPSMVIAGGNPITVIKKYDK